MTFVGANYPSPVMAFGKLVKCRLRRLQRSTAHILLEIKCVMIKKLLFSLLAIFGFSLVLFGDSFADSPSYTISATPQSNITLCSNTNPSDSVLSIACSDYLYINAAISGSAVSRLQLWTSVNNNYPINSAVLDTFSIKMPSTLSYAMITTSGSDFSGGGSITFSFSDTPIGSSGIVPSGSLNITENGTYDVTNYASAVVNVPTETVISNLPPYSALVVDSFWKYHVAIAGGLASIFAIFVVYRIIKSRLR